MANLQVRPEDRFGSQYIEEGEQLLQFTDISSPMHSERDGEPPGWDIDLGWTELNLWKRKELAQK